MPLTLTHPAIVLPLARGPLVPSALVIGAMAPDLPYFVGMADRRPPSHSHARLVGVVGLLAFAGLALLVFAMTHRIRCGPAGPTAALEERALREA